MKRVFFSMLTVFLGISIATAIKFFFDFDIIYFVIIYIPLGAFLLGQLLGTIYCGRLKKNNLKIERKDIVITCLIALIVFVGISFGKFQLEVNLDNFNQEYFMHENISGIEYLKEWFNNSKFTMINGRDIITKKAVVKVVDKIGYKILFILYNFLGLLLGITWTCKLEKSDIDIEYCEQCNEYKDIVFDFKVPLEVSERFISRLDKILSENEMTLNMELNSLVDEYVAYYENVKNIHPRIEVIVAYCSECNLYELNLRRFVYTPNKLIRTLEKLSNNTEAKLDKKYSYNRRISNEAVEALIKAKAID